MNRPCGRMVQARPTPAQIAVQRDQPAGEHRICEMARQRQKADRIRCVIELDEVLLIDMASVVPSGGRESVIKFAFGDRRAAPKIAKSPLFGSDG
jgi:hypothetical protein